MKVTADFLIHRRKMKWNNCEDLEKDKEYIDAVAEEIITNKNLRNEIIENPEKLIELVFYTVNKKKKTVPFFLNEVQKEFIEILNESKQKFKEGLITNLSFLVLKGRQQGFTTLITAYQLAGTITHKNFTGLTLADVLSNAEGIFQDKAKFVYDRLPEKLKPTEKYNSKRNLFFENLNSTWGSFTATKEVGRSKTVNFFHGSECAFWNCAISDIQASLGETFTQDSIKIYESTANGFNEYREMWLSGSHINCFFEWWKTSEYRLNFETKNMRTKFLNNIENSKDWIYKRLKWLKYDIGLDDEQLYWYYRKYRNYVDKEKIKQEYPCTPEEAFISSGQCYFSNKEEIIQKIKELEEKTNVIDRGYFEYVLDGNRVIKYNWISDNNGCIKMYEKPIDKYPYVIGGDTSGEGTDYNIGQVINNVTSKQVAVCEVESGETYYTYQMYCLGMFYNEALIGIENNFSTYPTKKLEELEYPNLYVRKNEKTYENKVYKVHGFETNKLTRPLILVNLQEIVLENLEFINDIDTLKEFLTFIKNKNGRAEAQQGSHDDRVMALAITYYIREQQSYKIMYDVEKEESKFWEEWNRDGAIIDDYDNYDDDDIVYI